MRDLLGGMHSPGVAWNARWTLIVLFAAIIAAISLQLAARDLLSIKTLDKKFGDFRIALCSPTSEQRDDITLVLINENSLRDYQTISPINRDLLARLIAEIDAARPKAIGLDFIFDRQTPGTEALVNAVRDTKSPVVLGGLDDRYVDHSSAATAFRDGLQAQEAILGSMGRPTGHLWVERDIDTASHGNTTARYVGKPNIGQPGRESFSAVLAKAVGFQHEPANQIIAWLKSSDDRLFAEIPVRRHDPASLKYSQTALLSPSDLTLITDRIVIIGANLGDRDQHTTPLSISDYQPLPGIMIHAQAVAQRIDGNRDIRSVPDIVTFFFCMLMTIGCLLLVRRIRFHPRKIALSMLAAFSIILFWLFRIDLPTAPLAFAWLVGALGGYASDWIFDGLGVESTTSDSMRK